MVTGHRASDRPAAWLRQRRRVPRAALALLLVIAGLAPGVAGPAVAVRADSCPSAVIGDAAILGGQVVFVGTVVSVSNDDRWATVRIEERWIGADALPDQVDVHGGPDAGVTSGFERTYRLVRYLFVVKQASGFFFDDSCTATQQWSPALARLRPRGVTPTVNDAEEVLPPPSAPIDLPVVPIALFGALAIAVMSYLLILRGRRRPPDWYR